MENLFESGNEENKDSIPANNAVCEQDPALTKGYFILSCISWLLTTSVD